MSGSHASGPRTGAADGVRVRDLLARCGRTSDRAERARLLARLATELERAADEIATAGCGSRDAEIAAGLRGQAAMARFAADLDTTRNTPLTTG